jgi:hypothetical protein
MSLYVSPTSVENNTNLEKILPQIQTESNVSPPIKNPDSFIKAFQQDSPQQKLQLDPLVIQEEKVKIDKYYLFENENELANVVRYFGKNVFSEKELSDDMLNFIINNFLSEKTNGLPIIDDLALKSQNMIDIFKNFWNIAQKEFITDDITLKSLNSKISKGSFGEVYLFGNDIIKIIKNQKNKSSVFNVDLANGNFYNEDIFLWMIELCVYVIIMSILRFVDCNTIVDESIRNKCISNRYLNQYDKDTFIGISDIFSKIYRPVILKINPAYPNYYSFGYHMEKYDETYCGFVNKSDPINVLKSLYQAIDLFEKINMLGDLGITILHRDVHCNNIMVINDGNDFKIRLIDFGFLCGNIMFKSNQYISFGRDSLGTQENKSYLCKNRYNDIIMLIMSFLKYSDGLFKKLNNLGEILKEKFLNIIKDKNTYSDIDNKNDPYYEWNYARKVTHPNRTNPFGNDIYQKLKDVVTAIIKEIDKDTDDKKISDTIHSINHGSNVKTNDISSNDFLKLYIKSKMDYIKIMNSQKIESTQKK